MRRSRVTRNRQALEERYNKYKKEVLRKRRIYRDLQGKRDGLIARAAAKVAARLAAKYPRALSEAEAESDVEGEKKTMPEEVIKGKLKKKVCNYFWKYIITIGTIDRGLLLCCSHFVIVPCAFLRMILFTIQSFLLTSECVPVLSLKSST
jgi:hypothetical protein